MQPGVLIVLPTSLEDLTILGGTWRFWVAEDGKTYSLPNLRAFAVEAYTERLGRYLPDPETAPEAKLHHLSLTYCKEASFKPFVLESCQRSYFSELTDLTLDDCDIDDEILEHLAASCPRLTTLDIKSNPKVTGVGVKALVLKPGDKLRTLDLTYCSKVSGDAVEWARSKEVDVKYKYPQVASGKKVRLV